MGKEATILLLDVRQYTGQDLEPEVLLIPGSVSPALDDPDLGVEVLDEAKGDRIFRLAVGSDAVPVPVDELSELHIGLQALALDRGFPVTLEKAACPGFARVVPVLA